MKLRLIRKAYASAYKLYWVSLSRYNPRYATIKWYTKRLGRKPDLQNPTLLTEKLQYLKLNDYFRNPTVCQCADKFAVREFVESRGCQEILNDLFFVYNSTGEIDWDELPGQFVLKCNHGCGGNIICRDKNMLNKREAVAKLDKWMHQEYGLEHVEYSYEGIPRKIICEKLIETEDGQLPRDYKIFCSYGVPKLIYVISDRKDTTENLDYFTPDWEWIPVRNGVLTNAGAAVRKPDNLNELLDYASKLSKGFPIVRVDLYNEFQKVIFGELTFLPTGGCFKLDPPEYDRKFGDLFPIEIKKDKK